MDLGTYFHKLKTCDKTPINTIFISHSTTTSDSRLATEVKDAYNVTGTCVWRHQNVCSTSATY